MRAKRRPVAQRETRAVLFDLFGTLVHFDATRLPMLRLPEGGVPSTVPAYAGVLAEIAPNTDTATFHQALVAVSVEIARERRRTLRELPSRERFSRALRRVGVKGPLVGQHAERLSVAHMERLVDATVAPAANRELLERLQPRLSLGCISNFDHAPSAISILNRTGLARFLSAVVISDAIGVCKPSALIFEEGLRVIGVEAAEAMFVGDTFDDDIRGATAAGLRAVWLNAKQAAAPEAGVPAATITELPEIEGLLDV